MFNIVLYYTVYILLNKHFSYSDEGCRLYLLLYCFRPAEVTFKIFKLM